MPVLIPTMPQPSHETLTNLSEYVKHALPSSYLNFINNHDGARPEENLTRIAGDETSVSRFIPAIEAVSLGKQIDGWPPRVIPLAEDDCGNYFYVDAITGVVNFWNHEIDGADEYVARDVSGFIEMLQPLEVSQIKPAPGQARQVWVNPAFNPEF